MKKLSYEYCDLAPCQYASDAALCPLIAESSTPFGVFNHLACVHEIFLI